MEISLVYFFGQDRRPLLHYDWAILVKLSEFVIGAFLEPDADGLARRLFVGPLFSKNFEFDVESEGTKFIDLLAQLILNN